jgi:hypothetical protein
LARRFDFSVEYKLGTTNVVADAVSRCDIEEGDLLALSAPQFDFIDRLRQAQLLDPALIALSGDITAGDCQAPWSVVDGLV